MPEIFDTEMWLETVDHDLSRMSDKSKIPKRV